MDKVKISTHPWAIWQRGKLVRDLNTGEIFTKKQIKNCYGTHPDKIYKDYIKQGSTVAWIR